MIQPDQILTYDNAAKKVREALAILNTINIANMNSEDARALALLVRETHVLGAKLFSDGHAAFIAERFSDQPETADQARVRRTMESIRNAGDKIRNGDF